MQETSALSIAQTIRLLGIGRSTLYGIIKEGRLPVRKLGKRTLIMRDDLDVFIAPCHAKAVTGELTVPRGCLAPPFNSLPPKLIQL